MLLKLILTESRFFYKINITAQKDFLVATAPTPKNSKQKNLLVRFLMHFEKRIIYPLGFNCEGYPAPYPAFEIYCKKLLVDFLEKCRKSHPDIAVITPNGLIRENYYLDLSEYVGKIVLKSQKQDNELKFKLLSHSGTVIEYNTEYDENKNYIAVLTMPQKGIKVL